MPNAEKDAPVFTSEDLALWRADAHHINAHAELFMPETSTMAWRFLALLEQYDRVFPPRDGAA